MSVDTELKSLVSLLDDPDEVVVSAVNQRMFSRGGSVIDDLSALCDMEPSRKRKKYIAEKIIYLSNEFTIEEISNFVKEEELDLWQGLFLISKLLLPGLGQKSFDDRLFPFIEQINEQINENQTAPEKIEIFNHLFYKRFLFKCRDYPFTRESTSIFLSAINSRHANPLIISIIYFLFARSVGIDIYPLCFPGGFVPAYVEDEKVLFYIDIFRNGEMFFEDRLVLFLEAQGINVDENVLEVREDWVLLIVYLELLILLYDSKGDFEMVNLLNRAISLFPDERFLENEP